MEKAITTITDPTAGYTSSSVWSRTYLPTFQMWLLPLSPWRELEVSEGKEECTASC
jgi:hypothetical protein